MLGISSKNWVGGDRIFKFPRLMKGNKPNGMAGAYGNFLQFVYR
ncbi:hypothetical protein [Nostoc sp.]